MQEKGSLSAGNKPVVEMLPHYIFLPSGDFVLSIADQDMNEITLIHASDRDRRITLTGNFASALFQQLNQAKPSKQSSLKIIETQHQWLAGLSSASLEPFDIQTILIGDTLGLLFLEITDQCNERCIHCYASSSPECHDFLTLDEIKQVLTQARSLGQPFVQFTGGDPLIHQNLVKAVAYAFSLDFEGIEIYTNGLLLTDVLLEQLFPFNPIFAFSLYSPDELVHDAITQTKGSFKKTVAAIYRAQDMALKVRIGMAVMEQNVGHEQAMLDFVKSEFYLEPTSVRFDPVHQTGRGSQLNTQHISLVPSQNSHMPDSNTEALHHQVVQQDKLPLSPAISSKPIRRRGKLAVCANGDVSPCIFNRKQVLGNIRSKSFGEILVGEHAGEGNLKPSVERWNDCQHNLSCSDCQMVAYTLGDKS